MTEGLPVQGALEATVGSGEFLGVLLKFTLRPK
jgi:hypothetical protein